MEENTSPFVSSEGHALCFNGEIFGGLPVATGQNDGACLMDALTRRNATVPEVFGRLRGPWAAIYWDPHTQRLWLGRDVLGRRSLLAHFPDTSDPRFILTSVSELEPATQQAVPGPAGAALASVSPSPAGAEAAALALMAPHTDLSACTPPRATRESNEEAEEGEPVGSDGFWTELAPGLYSIDFGLPTAAASARVSESAERRLGDADAAARSDGCQSIGHTDQSIGDPNALVRSIALGAREAFTIGAQCREMRLGDLGRTMVRHPWTDPLLKELEAYRRAEAVAALPAGSGRPAEKRRGEEGSGADSEGTAAGKAVGLRAQPVEPFSQGVDGPAKAGMPHEDGTSGGFRESDSGAVQGVYSSYAAGLARVQTDPEEAVRALLNVLLAAVRVRCASIETRSPHPSAAFAPAAAQPSWRRPDPLDFTTAASPVRATAKVPATPATPADSPAATAAAHPKAAVAVPVMILFSGGVDSVLLAALAHRSLPPEVPIDLSTVCFAGGTSPDREAARSALEELAAACPGRQWRLVEVDGTLADVDRHRARLLSLLRPAGTVMDLNIGAALWLAVAGQGTVRLPAAAQTPAVQASAAAAYALQPPSGPEPSAVESSPEMTGSPLETRPGDFYGSPARVVLLGHGADEQCGGYGRHRTRFRSGGAAGLSAELEVDVRRLWLRNLGRDDRLVSDWGREARHPFLDEQVMGLLLRLPLSCILDMELPPGQGDKRILRAALRLLGLPLAAGRVKRAIQFGSRIGKMSNRRDFGSNRAANRQNAGGLALQDVGRAAMEVAASAWTKSGPS